MDFLVVEITLNIELHPPTTNNAGKRRHQTSLLIVLRSKFISWTYLHQKIFATKIFATKNICNPICRLGRTIMSNQNQTWEMTNHILSLNFQVLNVVADLRASGGGGNSLLGARIPSALTSPSHVLGKPSAQGELKIGIWKYLTLLELNE